MCVRVCKYGWGFRGRIDLFDRPLTQQLLSLKTLYMPCKPFRVWKLLLLSLQDNFSELSDINPWLCRLPSIYWREINSAWFMSYCLHWVFQEIHSNSIFFSVELPSACLSMYFVFIYDLSQLIIIWGHLSILGFVFFLISQNTPGNIH